MSEIKQLFDKLREYTYPEKTMKMVSGEISGRAFFPGGKGTFDNSDIISDKDIMILGQDFDCEKNYKKSLLNGKEDIDKNPTWKNLLAFLDEIKINRERCFFTNAILGIRKGDKGTGKSPAFKDEALMENCRKFFYFQIELQKPKAIFVLGKYTAEFLSKTSNDLESWSTIKNFKSVDEQNDQVKQNVTFYNNSKSSVVLLTHPSFRSSNIHRRSYNGKVGNEAEIAMTKLIL